MYVPGYRFQTYAPVDEKRKPLPFFLYDRVWDHSKTPEENILERQRVVELTDGCTVEVVFNDAGRVFVKLDSGEQGYLG